MAQSMFPRRRSETDTDTDSHAEFVSLQDSDEVLQALATETGRQILAVLRENALPPSEIADSVGTSIQNITYHLTRLEDAGIVEAVDTWYSSRGREMDVYAVAADPVVFCIGDPSQPSTAGTGNEECVTDRLRAEFEYRE